MRQVGCAASQQRTDRPHWASLQSVRECVGGQSPRRALERSPHALFKLRQKAQCVWLVAEVDRVGRVTIGVHLDGLLLRARATAATAAATSLA